MAPLILMKSFEEYLQVLRHSWASSGRRWFVSFRSPIEIWSENPTYLSLEVVMFLWAFLSLRHAFKYGGRYLQLWFTALFHGLVVEIVSYLLPDIDSFWHGHSSLIFFKQRFPLHIMLFYPCFHYTTNVVVYRMKLPRWSEPFAVGLADCLLDVPFDILGIKYLWWTWHDTEPNIFDRSYHVPITSYMFHLSFASSFTLILNTSRWLLTGSEDKLKATDKYFSEFVCMMLTALLSMAVAAFTQFIPLYHIFHDFNGVHTGVCLTVMLSIYMLLVWIGDRQNGREARNVNTSTASKNKRLRFDELSLAIVMHYLFYIILVFVGDPNSYRSTGPHEPVGDCDSITYINTVSGKLLPKRTYLCLSNYTEPYYDFHCLSTSDLPTNGSHYYTICGTPFTNLVEYKLLILAACFVGLAFFYQVCFGSARQDKLKKQ